MKRSLGETGLRLVLTLYPRPFQDRFSSEVEALYRDLRAHDPRSARRMVFGVLRNLPGTHLDHRRIADRRHTTYRSSVRRQEAHMLDFLQRDLFYSARRLTRSPITTLLAAATLALGIGGTTAIFSVINGVLFNPLSAPSPQHLVHVFEQAPDRSELPLSYDSFRDYQQQTRSLEGLAVVRSQSVTVNDGKVAPERIRGQFVSASFFAVLGETPFMGRSIAAGEDVPGGERTAVLSHGFWQRRFGGDPAVLGQVVKFNNEDHVIVGVMGSEFQFPIDTTEAWLSLHTYPRALDRNHRTFLTLGRLADGVSLSQAQEELAMIADGLAEAYPDNYQDITASAAQFTETLTGSRTRELFGILLMAVTMVLLIGAANVANLQLAQATGRFREMAIRTAVGAERGRLLSQLLIESLLLALVGGVLGIAVAFGGVSLLTTYGPGRFGRLYAVDPDPRVLIFALAVSLLTGILFGLMPARRAARVNLIEGLQEGGRGNGPGQKGQRLRAGLVIAQVALAVMLVISAGLLMRSFVNLHQVDVGFDKAQLLTLQFRIPANKYETDEQVINFFDDILERVAAVPGVEGVASALGMPFTGDEPRIRVLDGGVDPGEGVEVPTIRANVVSQNYFEHMKIPMLAGRGFSSGDNASGAPVAVISEQAAITVWPDTTDFIGRTFAMRGDDTLFRVVGVVGDIYNRGLRDDVDPMVYFSYRQDAQRFATIAARVNGDPHAFDDPIRQAIWEIDSEQPLWEIMTQDERIAQWTGTDRFMASLLGIFALVALTLAAIGIGGVLAHSVSMRRRELGIRLSLGASQARILKMILGHGLSLVSTGVVIGFFGALALSQTLASWLFGVAAFDATIFLAAPVLLIVVALLSAMGPAWRAAWLDPVHTLRDE